MNNTRRNQLPSGKFRVQAYDYTDLSGKRHYKSFTASSKKQAAFLAAEWKMTKEARRFSVADLTVYETIERYIELKEPVLSPSTLRSYLSHKDTHFRGMFGRLHLSEIDSPTVQLWISDLCRSISPKTNKPLSHKTIHNIYGLFSAAIEVFSPGLQIKSTLPTKIRPQLRCPNDEDVKRLLQATQGTDLEIAVLLAAFGPLRRGEICALEDSDIRGNTISVTKDMVYSPDHVWIIKQTPKTTLSNRRIELPDWVIERLQGREGRLVSSNPDQITGAFHRALKQLDIPEFRFHDLRHYSASIMHAIGVPDQYILQRGGWASDHVMKGVYRNAIDQETLRQNEKINAHFHQFMT